MEGKIHVFGSIYAPSEPAVVFAHILNELGKPANEANVVLNLFNPDGTKILDSVSMSYISSSNGIYKYEFVAPAEIKRMVADIKSTNPETYGAESISVPEWAAGCPIDSDPPTGMQKITNMYYNPETGLPEFEVEG
ncbi:MAG: hypothetical protein KAS87_06495 [Candidatus Omnitrophica bacterium]|nr:hypothetical protein [Candidatus Omnitrophota bacterium]